MSPGRFALAALVCVLAGLAAPPGEAARRSLAYRFAQDAVERLDFAATHRVRTTFDRLPPEAEPYDTDALAASLAEVRSEVGGSLERVVGRVFRDSSLGLVTRVVGLRATVDRGGGAQPVALEGLEGKSVSMRVLDSGELLASSGWQHLAGAGRSGDLVLPVLLQSVLRLPYAPPPPDGTMPTAFRLRVPLDPLLNLDQNWSLEFAAAEPPADCGRRCVALDYMGTVTEAAVDAHPARPMKREGTAEVVGTIVLGPRSRLVRHDFRQTWTHRVTSHRENDTERAAITQVHEVTGWIAQGGDP